MELFVEDLAAPERLDRWLAERLTDVSRSRLQSWIREGRVLVDDVVARAATKLRGGESIEVEPKPLEPLRAFPEPIPLDVLFEDDHLIAVNKAAGMTVHAGAGEAARSGTLVNALLHRFERLSSLGGELRPGIVHRLDRFTSGVILVAKTDRAHRELARMFEERRVQKTYWAVVHGRVEPSAPPRRSRLVRAEGFDWIRLESPIGRDPRNRRRMAVVSAGRSAVTDYRPLGSDGDWTLVEVRIHTGRTHQIRVHLSSVGRPIVGDRLYGAPDAGLETERFFLHARRLRLDHPVGGATLDIEAPPPEDFASLLESRAL